jgi:hypothetical protein
MSISNRFHLFIASTTITVAYWLATHINITTHPATRVEPIARLILAYIGSAAFYQLLATILRWVFDHLRLLRKIVFGDEYLEGTWIGAYGQTPHRKFTVEIFEQTVDGTVIQGFARAETGVLYAKWTSSAVSFDAGTGSLTYSYDCEILANNMTHQGIAFFTAQRKGPRAAAQGFVGYSADLVDGFRSTNFESKLSDRPIDLAAAFEAAKKRYPV